MVDYEVAADVEGDAVQRSGERERAEPDEVCYPTDVISALLSSQRAVRA
jgi:hypothetical protein